MQFEYFYGNEAEQFTFYRIPKILITSPMFKKVSDSAKILYGLMLDRMGLSLRNGWVDEKNRAYIYFKTEDVMEYMNCATEKATRLIQELDAVKGVGLIERVKQGQGKPARVYLKKYVTETEDTADNTLPSAIESQDFRKSKNKTFGNQKSRLSEVESQDFRKSKNKTFDNQKSRLSETEKQDFRKSKCNNNEFNNTEFNNINPINQEDSDNAADAEERWIEKKRKTVEKIKEQIDYDSLIATNEKRIVDNIVMVMTEVELSEGRTFKIGNVEMPDYKIREQYKLLNYANLEVFMLDFNDVKHRIHAELPYMVAALYNVPLTADVSIANRVKSDMRGG